MNIEQKPHIGKLLGAHRRTLRNPRVSQEYLAHLIDRALVTVQKIEQGVANPSEEVVYAAGRALRLGDEDIANMIEGSNYASTAYKQRSFKITYGDDRRLRELASRSGTTEELLVRRFINEGLNREEQDSRI